MAKFQIFRAIRVDVIIFLKIGGKFYFHFEKKSQVNNKSSEPLEIYAGDRGCPHSFHIKIIHFLIIINELIIHSRYNNKKCLPPSV